MRVRVRRRVGGVPAPIAWARRNGAVYSAGLTLLGLISFAVCLWRWCWDLRVVGWFPFADGAGSHWQVWFFGGVVAVLLGGQLAVYARRRAPRI